MISVRKEPLRDMCANAINDSWIYSAHWTDNWRKEALEDAKKVLCELQTRRYKVESVIELLEKGVPND